MELARPNRKRARVRFPGRPPGRFLPKNSLVTIDLIRITRKDGLISVLLCYEKMDYKSKRWRKLREQILRRDGYMCQESLRYGKHVPASTVHHVFPISKYPHLTWDPRNLVSLCSAEHNAMHIRDTDELTDKGMKLLERIKKQRGIEEDSPPPRGE